MMISTEMRVFKSSATFKVPSKATSVRFVVDVDCLVAHDHEGVFIATAGRIYFLDYITYKKISFKKRKKTVYNTKIAISFF